MSKQQPKMIGAHAPSRPQAQRRKANLYPIAREFNAAFDAWANRPDRAHLVYQRRAFGEG